jgi:putative colanic acid biosynthesis acetyltransferase WcaF
MNGVDLSKYKNKLSKLNQLKRLLWSITWFLFVKLLPRSMGKQWKIFLLRLFGDS